MRVYTVQGVGWWERLRADGVVRGERERVWPGFRGAYGWMRGQMRRRVMGYGGGDPVWVWERPRPDLRHRAHLPRGTHGVRVELEVPAERVLLSDFQAWHCVLNGWPVALTEEEDAAWDARQAPAEERRRAMRRTWERVFDLEELARSPLWGSEERQVQGVVEWVRVEEVRRVTRFLAR